MLTFWLTVFPALVVFIGRLPATMRRVRAQRDALRPVQPIARADHLPCVLNTIGAVLTEFSLLGLLALAVFVGTSAAFGTLGNAPDLSTGIRQFSLGAIGTITAVGITIAVLLSGGVLARYVIIFGVALAVLFWMVMSSAGDQAPAILLFAVLAVGAPTLLVAALRRFL